MVMPVTISGIMQEIVINTASLINKSGWYAQFRPLVGRSAANHFQAIEKPYVHTNVYHMFPLRKYLHHFGVKDSRKVLLAIMTH